jgi:hypothetical protein
MSGRKPSVLLVFLTIAVRFFRLPGEKSAQVERVKRRILGALQG